MNSLSHIKKRSRLCCLVVLLHHFCVFCFVFFFLFFDSFEILLYFSFLIIVSRFSSCMRRSLKKIVYSLPNTKFFLLNVSSVSLLCVLCCVAIYSVRFCCVFRLFFFSFPLYFLVDVFFVSKYSFPIRILIKINNKTKRINEN